LDNDPGSISALAVAPPGEQDLRINSGIPAMEAAMMAKNKIYCDFSEFPA
jgi:hypothetical protein